MTFRPETIHQFPNEEWALEINQQLGEKEMSPSEVWQEASPHLMGLLSLKDLVSMLEPWIRSESQEDEEYKEIFIKGLNIPPSNLNITRDKRVILNSGVRARQLLAYITSDIGLLEEINQIGEFLRPRAAGQAEYPWIIGCDVELVKEEIYHRYTEGEEEFSHAINQLEDWAKDRVQQVLGDEALKTEN